MRFGIGDKVRIRLPKGASWNRKTATATVSTQEINGAEGVITQVLSFSGQPECKVLTAFGEFRFWERDLEATEPVEAPAVEPKAEEGDDGG